MKQMHAFRVVMEKAIWPFYFVLDCIVYFLYSFNTQHRSLQVGSVCLIDENGRIKFVRCGGGEQSGMLWCRQPEDAK